MVLGMVICLPVQQARGRDLGLGRPSVDKDWSDGLGFLVSGSPKSFLMWLMLAVHWVMVYTVCLAGSHYHVDPQVHASRPLGTCFLHVLVQLV